MQGDSGGHGRPPWHPGAIDSHGSIATGVPGPPRRFACCRSNSAAGACTTRPARLPAPCQLWRDEHAGTPQPHRAGQEGSRACRFHAHLARVSCIRGVVSGPKAQPCARHACAAIGDGQRLVCTAPQGSLLQRDERSIQRRQAADCHDARSNERHRRLLRSRRAARP